MAENDRVRQAVEKAIELSPAFFKEKRHLQRDRVREELSLIYKPKGRLVDLGGGSGFHALCAVLAGMEAYCVDNFRVRPSGHICDSHSSHDEEAEKIAGQNGVKFIHADLTNWEPPFEKESLDVVTSFDAIEHLHNSPKRTYRRLMESLKCGGHFLIGAPNAVNLLKRVRVLFGRTNYSSFDQWYLPDYFIGHVREPVVKDFRLIARDLNFVAVSIFGRNWIGLQKFGPLAKPLDTFLRGFPSLCSDIYLLGEK